jgi:hypothetical protein
MIPQLQRETTVSTSDSTRQWSLATKITFRFLFSYFLLYIGPGAVGSLSSYQTSEQVNAGLWNRLWHPLVPWFATHVLSLSGNFTETPNGSGDQAYDYVLILCILLVAAVITAIWSALDRKRTDYRRLYQWLRVLMGLVVGWAMLGYGVKKLLGSQFPAPDLARLIEPFGAASPKTMLWTFMGVSPLYSFFGGLGETIGGALLMFPGLTTLGALISGAMAANVLLLNLSYDVPRKIFSIHLLLMCLILLIPDMRRLANVLVFNRPTDAVLQVPLIDDKLLNRAAVFAQVIFGVYILWLAGGQSLKDVRENRKTVPTPIRGVWIVDEFTEDGVARPPLLTDAVRWQTVVFDKPDLLTIVSMDGDRGSYYMQLDGLNKVQLWNLTDSRRRAILLLHPQSDLLYLDGQLDGHSITAKMKRVDSTDESRFPLLNKGLHWVNPTVDDR